MATTVQGGLYNGFAQITKCYFPKRGSFYTSPRTDACEEGWGVVNATDEQKSPEYTEGTKLYFGVCGDKSIIKLLTYDIRKEYWKVGVFPGDQLFGNIDWRGPLRQIPKGQKVPPEGRRPRTILSWYGPPSRYFPCDAFAYDTEKEEHRMIYTQGGVIGILPLPVLGAGYVKGPDRHPDPCTPEEAKRVLSEVDIDWLIAICKDGLGVKVFAKRDPDWIGMSYDLYLPEYVGIGDAERIADNKLKLSENWLPIGKFSANEFLEEDSSVESIEFLDQRTPWFFPENGLAAQCMREVKVTFKVRGMLNTHETTARCALHIESDAATVFQLPLSSPYTYTVKTTISTNSSVDVYTWLGKIYCEILTTRDEGVPGYFCHPNEWINKPTTHYWRETDVVQRVDITGLRSVAVDWDVDEQVLCYAAITGYVEYQFRAMLGIDFEHVTGGTPTSIPRSTLMLTEPGGVSVLAAARADLAIEGTFAGTTERYISADSLVPWIVINKEGWALNKKLFTGSVFNLPFSTLENKTTNTRIGWVVVYTALSGTTSDYNIEGILRCLKYFVIQAGSGATELIEIPTLEGSFNPPPVPYTSYDSGGTFGSPERNDFLTVGALEIGAFLAPDDFGGASTYRTDLIGNYPVRPAQIARGSNLTRALTWQKKGKAGSADPADWCVVPIDNSVSGQETNYLEGIDKSEPPKNSTPPTYEPVIPPESTLPGVPKLKTRHFAGISNNYIHFMDLRDGVVLRFEEAQQQEVGYYGYNMALSYMEELAETKIFADKVTREYCHPTFEEETTIKITEDLKPREPATGDFGWFFQNILYWPESLDNEFVLNSYDGSYPSCITPYNVPDPLAFTDRGAVAATGSTQVFGDVLKMAPIFDYIGKGPKAYREGGLALSQFWEKLVSMKYTKPSAEAGKPEEVLYYNALFPKDSILDEVIATVFKKAADLSDEDVKTLRLFPLGPV